MFKLLPETLFLAINLVDRILAGTPNMKRDRLQLVGITSLLIASKYEEIYPPEIHDFVFIADNTYPKEEIFATEEKILIKLQWDLSTPSSLHFLRRFSKAAGSDYAVHTLGKFIIETALLDVNLLKWRPSEIAAAAIYISRKMTGTTPDWTPTLAHYTTYDLDHVRPIALEVNDFLRRTSKSSLKSVISKYSSSKNGGVAKLQLINL